MLKKNEDFWINLENKAKKMYSISSKFDKSNLCYPWLTGNFIVNICLLLLRLSKIVSKLFFYKIVINPILYAHEATWLVCLFKSNQSDPKDFTDSKAIPKTRKISWKDMTNQHKCRAHQSYVGRRWDTHFIMVWPVKYSHWNEDGNKHKPPDMNP